LGTKACGKDIEAAFLDRRQRLFGDFIGSEESALARQRKWEISGHCRF
jgi:hypothetical protein